ncbi:hypothetical protein NO1_0330 [Candidatus Termititenax aidoneus]|uniref:Uncharacterized protein n=1 Tax=Termititenax aidoneus TaxID=2218524 RepID=A0A388T9V2_TERA1|nr:hypothetical protein NO1_0330 [Candidatus Termititenax aidoneus]
MQTKLVSVFKRQPAGRVVINADLRLEFQKYSAYLNGNEYRIIYQGGKAGEIFLRKSDNHLLIIPLWRLEDKYLRRGFGQAILRYLLGTADGIIIEYTANFGLLRLAQKIDPNVRYKVIETFPTKLDGRLQRPRDLELPPHVFSPAERDPLTMSNIYKVNFHWGLLGQTLFFEKNQHNIFHGGSRGFVLERTPENGLQLRHKPSGTLISQAQIYLEGLFLNVALKNYSALPRSPLPIALCAP